LLGDAVSVLDVITAETEPQFFVVEPGVAVGGCEVEFGVFVATGFDDGVDVPEVTVALPVEGAVGVSVPTPFAIDTELLLQPASAVIITKPRNVNRETRRMGISSITQIAVFNRNAPFLVFWLARCYKHRVSDSIE